MYYMVIHDSKRSAQVWAGIRVDMAVFVKPLWWKPLQKPGFCINFAPSAWNLVIHGETWFKAIGSGLSQNKSWYGHFGVLIVDTPVLDKTQFLDLSPGERPIGHHHQHHHRHHYQHHHCHHHQHHNRHHHQHHNRHHHQHHHRHHHQHHHRHHHQPHHRHQHQHHFRHHHQHHHCHHHQHHHRHHHEHHHFICQLLLQSQQQLSLGYPKKWPS